MKRFSYYLWAQLHSYEVSESRPQDKNPLPRQRVFIFHGGDEGDRTPDLSVANAALSQLSYIP